MIVRCIKFSVEEKENLKVQTITSLAEVVDGDMTGNVIVIGSNFNPFEVGKTYNITEVN